MDRQQVLSREYEICQSKINSIGSQYWTIFSIFLPINTGLLVWLLSSIITRNSLSTFGTDVRLLAVVLGIGMILIITFLWRYFNRVNFIISINYYRMRHIETELGMWSNRLIDIIDNWKTISEEERSEFVDLRNHYPREQWWRFWQSSQGHISPVGRGSMRSIFLVLMLLWAAFIVLVFVYDP